MEKQNLKAECFQMKNWDYAGNTEKS
jgi:hypothetical protein